MSVAKLTTSAAVQTLLIHRIGCTNNPRNLSPPIDLNGLIMR